MSTRHSHTLIYQELRNSQTQELDCASFKSLQHNTSLVHLNFRNTGLVATEDTAQALTAMIQDNKTLTHLDLSEELELL